MKRLRLSLILISFLAQSTAYAFLSESQEQRTLAYLNARFVHLNFENIRCSLRNRQCLLQFSNVQGQHNCLVGLISDATDLVQENEDKGLIRLAPYAEDAVTHCLAEIR